jgi:hypothetical protein
MDSLKVLDQKWPIREADMTRKAATSVFDPKQTSVDQGQRHMTSECGFGTISRAHVQKQACAVLRALAGEINDEVDTSSLLWRDVPAHPCQVC